MTTTESPVLSHGKVVVVLDRAEFEALDLFALHGLEGLNADPEAFPPEEHRQGITAHAWLDRVRAVFAGADQ